MKKDSIYQRIVLLLSNFNDKPNLLAELLLRNNCFSKEWLDFVASDAFFKNKNGFISDTFNNALMDLETSLFKKNDNTIDYINIILDNLDTEIKYFLKIEDYISVDFLNNKYKKIQNFVKKL